MVVVDDVRRAPVCMYVVNFGAIKESSHDPATVEPQRCCAASILSTPLTTTITTTIAEPLDFSSR